MPKWQKGYSYRLAWVDALVILWAVSGALVVRFVATPNNELMSPTAQLYIAVTLVLAVGWWMILGLSGSRETRVFGYGTEEYKRVLSASFWLFGMVSTVSYLFQLDIARGYVALALPAGTSALLLARMLLRSGLRAQRLAGMSGLSVLLIGGVQGVEHLANALRGQPMAGYKPTAAYIPSTAHQAMSSPLAESCSHSDLPNLGHEPSVEKILEAVEKVRPDAVALSSGVALPPRVIRELGWALAELKVRMILAPALTDIAGPRIHTQPVAGLPLIHVSTPNLGIAQRLLKRTFDIVGASILMILFSPIFMVVALAVRIDSPGPAFFHQQRVGAGGVPFRMFKFRSMVIDAEERLESLKRQSDGNTVMFKLKTDPRVTRVGKFIRRYSLDELPQLCNVLNGTMSLVGPRPPLPSEVQLYQSHVHRRLMVRPGLTGLWQVSGRSLLSWDDTVRLDLYYVENWSIAGDIAILLKTLRAVVGRTGAY